MTANLKNRNGQHSMAARNYLITVIKTGEPSRARTCDPLQNPPDTEPPSELLGPITHSAIKPTPTNRCGVAAPDPVPHTVASECSDGPNANRRQEVEDTEVRDNAGENQGHVTLYGG